MMNFESLAEQVETEFLEMYDKKLEMKELYKNAVAGDKNASKEYEGKIRSNYAKYRPSEWLWCVFEFALNVPEADVGSLLEDVKTAWTYMKDTQDVKESRELVSDFLSDLYLEKVMG